MARDDQVIREYANLAREVSDAMTGLKETMGKALSDINDTNILHAQMWTSALGNNTEAIKANNITLRNMVKFQNILMAIMLLALVVLAGAEKILPVVKGLFGV